MLSKADDSNRWNAVVIVCIFSWAVMRGCSLASSHSHTHRIRKNHSEYQAIVCRSFFSAPLPVSKPSGEPGTRHRAQSSRSVAKGALRCWEEENESRIPKVSLFLLLHCRELAGQPAWGGCSRADSSASSWGTDADCRPEQGLLDTEGSRSCVQPRPCGGAVMKCSEHAKEIILLFNSLFSGGFPSTGRV